MKRKPSVLRRPHFWFSLSVYEQIRATLGAAPAETGGMIGGDTKRGVVSHFFQDTAASCTSTSYTPDTGTVNRALEQWNADGVRLMGFPSLAPARRPGTQRRGSRIRRAHIGGQPGAEISLGADRHVRR